MQLNYQQAKLKYSKDIVGIKQISWQCNILDINILCSIKLIKTFVKAPSMYDIIPSLFSHTKIGTTTCYLPYDVIHG